ncbi:hypothetical protein ESFECK385B1_20845 [Escherichia fergusonii]
MICSVKKFSDYLGQHGWIITHKNDLLEKLMHF